MKKILFIFLLLSAAAFGQFSAKGYLEAASGGGAYRNPRVRLGLETAYTFPNTSWGVGANAYVIPSGKADTRDGYTASFRLEGFKNVGNFQLGAGEGYAYTDTSLYSKHATHPYILSGYHTDGFGLTGRWFLPWGDQRNGLTGPEVFCDIPIQGHLGFRVMIEVYSSYRTDAPQLGRNLYGSGGGGITWTFR